MSAGQMRAVVTLLTPPVTDDGAGGQTGAYTTVARQVSAAIDPLSAFESYQAGAMQGGLTHRARVWYRTDLTPAMRLRDEASGQLYEVTGVRPDARRRWLELDLVSLQEAH